MTRLTWWFRIVGGFFVVLGIGFYPPLNEARLPFMMTVDAPTTSAVYRALVDWMLAFGAGILVLGAYLIYASQNPMKHLNLVWLVAWLEAVRGILVDVYFIARGYGLAFYVGFIIVHLIIIVTGLRFMRQAQAEPT